MRVKERFIRTELHQHTLLTAVLRNHPHLRSLLKKLTVCMTVSNNMMMVMKFIHS